MVLLVVIRLAATCAGVRQPVDGAVGVAAGAAATGTGAIVGGAGAILEAFRIGHHLRRERLLEGEIALLSSRVQELAAAEKENERLRGLLGLPSYARFGYVSAEVVARSMDLWFDTLVLNRGREHGITEQNLVVNSEGLVGEVVEAGHGYSRVRLLTNPDFALSVVSNTTSVGGIVRGQGPGRLSLEYIPAEAPLKLQEKVFTAGLARQADGRPRPRGIAVGYVDSIKKTANLTTLQVTVKPVINVSNLGPVIVIVNQ